MAESLLVGVSPLLFFLCLCNGVNTQCPLTRRVSSVTFILNPKHAHQQGRLNWSKPYVLMSAAVVKSPTPRVSIPCALPIKGGRVACWRQQRKTWCVKKPHQLC